MKLPKKVKKPSKTKQGRKCMKLWGEIIHKKGKCEVCGKKENLQAHHFIGRRNLTLRYEVRNGVLLCALHHKLGRQSAHEDPQWFNAWMMQNRPDDYNYVWEHKEKLSPNLDYEKIRKDLLTKV